MHICTSDGRRLDDLRSRPVASVHRGADDALYTRDDEDVRPVVVGRVEDVAGHVDADEARDRAARIEDA